MVKLEDNNEEYLDEEQYIHYGVESSNDSEEQDENMSLENILHAPRKKPLRRKKRSADKHAIDDEMPLMARKTVKRRKSLIHKHK